MLNKMQSRAWAEINLDNIASNVQNVKSLLTPHTEIMGVVKADAYGHGVREVANTLIENGVTRLAVSMLDEAIELRNDGIKIPILVLSYTDPSRANEIIDYDITQTIFSHDLAASLSECSILRNTKIKVHIKIDTGMGRVGFLPGYSAVKDVIRISKLGGLVIEGLFTHFAMADELNEMFTKIQFERFMNICSELARVGIHIPIKHVANSASIIRFPEMHLDMVRAGIILYGMYPSEAIRNYAEEILKDKFYLKPAMTFKARVIFVKKVEETTPISYGCTYVTKKLSNIATVSVGYADGYLRQLGNKARVMINNNYFNVCGRVCMDQTMVDVSDATKNISVGDEVILFGGTGDNIVSIEEVANYSETINYELVSIVGRRVPRIYFKGGKIVNGLNYLLR